MTFSVCLTDGRIHGVASATHAPAVGALGPFLTPDGVLCTQSIVNVSLGSRAARKLANGDRLDETINTLLDVDPAAEKRQVHGIDQNGRTVTHTGDECIEWCGHKHGDGYTLAGNMLVGPSVLEAMDDAIETTSTESIVDRLLAILKSGVDAGGDKRGGHPQSAALKVYHPDTPRLTHDLRVDEHDTAVDELHRLVAVTRNIDKKWRKKYPETVYQRYPENYSE